MGFGGRQIAQRTEEERRRAALPHQTVMSPAPGTGLAPVAPPPETGRSRSAATLTAIEVAKRKRRQALAPGKAASVTGRPTTINAPLNATPRTLVGY